MRILDAELRAVLIAYDELLAYWEIVGYEGSLDDEEMPDPRIPDSLQTLRGLLTKAGYLDANGHVILAAGKEDG